MAEQTPTPTTPTSTPLAKGSLFDPVLVTQLINTVKGHSAIANLCANKPIPFNGNKEFTFSLSGGMDIVGESDKKSAETISLSPKTIVPTKMVYQARVSDEFMYGSAEAKMDILKTFIDGCAAMIAKGLDIAVMHGLNPKSLTASTIIGENCLDKAVTQTADYDSTKPDQVIDTAISTVENADRDVTGIAISPAVRNDIANLRNTASGARLFPEFAFGAAPATLGNLNLDVNSTVSKGAADVRGYVGDFQNMLRWGYAKDVSFEVIEYGDPDNTGNDLKGYNQVCLRVEVYLGWGILDASSFAKIVQKEKQEGSE